MSRETAPTRTKSRACNWSKLKTRGRLRRVDVDVLRSTTDKLRSHDATPAAVVRVARVADVSKQIFMRVKLFCAFRSRHPHPWMYTPLPIDTHLYFYHHPTTPTVGIVYDTIRLIISCLYATIDRTANCTRHSDSKTVAPRALLQPFRSKFEFFPRSTFTVCSLLQARVSARKPVKLVLTGLSAGPGLTPARDFSSAQTTVRTRATRIPKSATRIRQMPHSRPSCGHRRYEQFQVYDKKIELPEGSSGTRDTVCSCANLPR